MNLLDWVDAEQQRPVMAHELTHALQDQSFDLEKWMRAGEVDLAAKKQPSPADIANDETIAARQAVVEGQATVTLLDYLLTPTGQSVTTAPQLVEAMKAGMMAGTPDSFEFRKAPIYLKQAMLFGYLHGLDFTIALLKAGGKQKAFEGAFLNPPQSTRQIMQPETYLAGEKIDPVPLPDFERDFKNYERFDIGAIGEFDVAVMIEQYAGEEASKKLYPHWRGGYYYAVRPKGKESRAARVAVRIAVVGCGDGRLSLSMCTRRRSEPGTKSSKPCRRGRVAWKRMAPLQGHGSQTRATW